MHVILVPIGSHGDVHPFVAVGASLRDRGHRVSVVTNPHFQGLVERVGLEFVPLGTEELFHEAIESEDLWHPTRGFERVLRFTTAGIEPVFEFIRERYVPGETVVAAQVTAYGARIAQEALGVPLVTIDLQPALIRSAIAPPVLPRHGFVSLLPVPLRRWIFRLADLKVVDPLLAPAVNTFRSQFGLKPVSRVIEWWHSPERVLGLFPDWFAPPQADWPPQVELVGFPLYDEQEFHDLPVEVARFLEEGEPPILFTPGSAMRHGQGFFETAVEACRRLGRRGILVTRFSEQVPASLPATVRHVAYVPFSMLFPRCAAVVHHGGIGTTAQALAAGVPQVVMPLAHDQPDNARRLERLGVGRTLLPNRFRAPALARLLRTLLDSGQVASRCRTLAGRLEERDSIERACRGIERVHEAHLVRR